MASSNCLEFQILAVIRLSAARKSAYIFLDPNVVLSTFPRQRPFFKYEQHWLADGTTQRQSQTIHK